MHLFQPSLHQLGPAARMKDTKSKGNEGSAEDVLFLR
jgi:hypothetical protein